VVGDVSEQLSAGRAADELRTYRGALGRSSLRFEVVDLPSQADRLAWLAQRLPELPGSGIVYALTKRDTEAVAAWLESRGIPAVAYSGETPDAERLEVERRLLANEVKAVVATQALGMGYDKPDLGFVVHFQAPGSVIAYYQQVGRAGRALETADVVLLRGAEDRDIQDWFIESAFPPREHATAVVEHLAAADKPVRVPELLALANVGRGKVEAMLKILDVEGAVRREGTGWVRTGQPWSYDAERYERITALRREEQAEMAEFGARGGCLMLELQGALDDPHAVPCGRCAGCTAPRFAEPLDRPLVVAAQEHLRSRPLVLEPRKQWPATLESGARKIAEPLRLEEGRALARAGDGGWDPLIRQGRFRDGRFADELVEACVTLLAAWRPHPAPEWVTAVPSRRSGDLVPDLARRIAAGAGLPYLELLERAHDGPPQREMRNSAQQAANVAAAFARTAAPKPSPGLIVDDLWFSGWTLTTIGAQLRRSGAGPLYPLVLSLAAS
jgi:ATP-dependent DNA helicase RecQ